DTKKARRSEPDNKSGAGSGNRTTIRRLTAFRNDLYTTDPNKKSHRCNLRVTNGSLPSNYG
ncbi:TPA: hypothetical protein ACV8GE_000949, partial [Escherichia coli]